MRKISSENRLNLLGLMIFIYLLFKLAVLKEFILFFGILIFTISLLLNISNSIKNRKFFEIEIDKNNYIFDESFLDLIGIKLYEKLELEKKLFRDKLEKLSFFYEDKNLNNLIIDDVIKISKTNKIFSESNYISILSNNLLFLIFLKEKNFKEAYEYLEKVKKYFIKNHSKYIKSRDILHQSIDNEFILLYLLKHKSNKFVDKIINILIKLDKNIGDVYINSLNLSLKDKEYLLNFIIK